MIATGGKDAHVVPRVYGRVGYDVPVAQSATFRLKPYDTASDDDDASVVDEANAYAEGRVVRSQAGAGGAVDDPGGGIDDPGGGDTDDGWDSGWDCARGIFPPREYSPGPP